MMMQKDDSRGEVILYQAPDGTVKLDVRLEREMIWLNLNQMATLFERDKSVISRHLRSIYKEGELEHSATVAKYATVQIKGKRTVTRHVEFPNSTPSFPYAIASTPSVAPSFGSGRQTF